MLARSSACMRSPTCPHVLSLTVTTSHQSHTHAHARTPICARLHALPAHLSVRPFLFFFFSTVTPALSPSMPLMSPLSARRRPIKHTHAHLSAHLRPPAHPPCLPNGTSFLFLLFTSDSDTCIIPLHPMFPCSQRKCPAPHSALVLAIVLAIGPSPCAPRFMPALEELTLLAFDNDLLSARSLPPRHSRV